MCEKALDYDKQLSYSDAVCRHRLSKGGTLFKRSRYQHGSIDKEERKKGPAVWVYRWWEEDINGKLVHRKAQVGDVKKYPTESAAHAAADALRLTINNQCAHRSLRHTTINTLWEQYSQEELPLKALSTQDAYIIYARNWIVPRWGYLPLEQVKTVEVERWLRATGVADGTKAKIKCVMSALFSHAVRWEFCGHNQEWRSQSRYNKPEDFVFPFRKTARKQAVGSSLSVKEEDSACIQTNWNHWCGLAHFSALGWNHVGGDGRTSAHDSRLFAAQQPPCHEQIPAGDVEDQAIGAGQIGRSDFADGHFAEDKPNPISAVWDRSGMGPFSFGAYRPLTSPDSPDVRIASA
jgi:hypothetical protein